MAETKTKPTGVDVDDYIAAIDDERKRDDSRELVRMMQRVTGKKPYMWGPSIIGFDTYHYRYDSGHEGDAPIAAFAPRKANIVLYLSMGDPEVGELATRLGKCRTSKGCLYIKRLADVDMAVLERMVQRSVEWTREKYPS